MDLKLDLLDIKIDFLHGVMEEKIYMTRLEGFIEKERKRGSSLSTE